MSDIIEVYYSGLLGMREARRALSIEYPAIAQALDPEVDELLKSEAENAAKATQVRDILRDFHGGSGDDGDPS